MNKTKVCPCMCTLLYSNSHACVWLRECVYMTVKMADCTPWYMPHEVCEYVHGKDHGRLQEVR